MPPVRGPGTKTYLQLDVADFDGGEVLTVAALNLILVGLLILQHGDLGAAALADDLAGHAGLRGVGAKQNLLVVGVHRQNSPELDLFAHFTGNPFHTNGVAGSDTILLSPGLDDGVHHSSKSSRQTPIIQAWPRIGQRRSPSFSQSVGEESPSKARRTMAMGG